MFSRGRASLTLTRTTFVHGQSLGRGARPTVAPGLSTADAELARRVLRSRSGEEWWSLGLDAFGVSGPAGSGFANDQCPVPEGTLAPLLVSGLGEPVMAMWSPSDGSQRVYVMPPGHDLADALAWLSEHGLPAHAPAASRNLRLAAAPVPDALLSAKERHALAELDRLRGEHQQALAAAASALSDAKAVADARRDALLHGQAKELEAAVGDVFRDAGCTVTDLDEHLASTSSADLLVEADGSGPVLIEVKSSKGAAGEDLMDKLVKHLQVWPELRPDTAVASGLLVVNHHRTLPPEQRPERVFTRPEYTASAPHPAIGSAQLLRWWLQEDWDSIRRCIGGAPLAGPTGPVTTPQVPAAGRARRSWGWRRK